MCLWKATDVCWLEIVFTVWTSGETEASSPVILHCDFSCLIFIHLRLPEAARGKSKHYRHHQNCRPNLYNSNVSVTALSLYIFITNPLVQTLSCKG